MDRCFFIFVWFCGNYLLRPPPEVLLLTLPPPELRDVLEELLEIELPELVEERL